MDKLGHISDLNHNMKEMIIDLEVHFNFEIKNEDMTPYEYFMENIVGIECLVSSLRRELRKNKIRLKDTSYEAIMEEQNLHSLIKFPNKKDSNLD